MVLTHSLTSAEAEVNSANIDNRGVSLASSEAPWQAHMMEIYWNNDVVETANIFNKVRLHLGQQEVRSDSKMKYRILTMWLNDLNLEVFSPQQS